MLAKNTSKSSGAMEQIYRCLQPEFVSRFQCDGTKCDAKCCKKWRIDVDEDTLKKWKKLPRNERDEILEKLYEEDDKTYILLRTEDGSCAFLRDDCLCSVQKKYGAGYLSNTCTLYPRQTRYFPDLVERTLSLTCPLALDLALLSKEPITFEEVEIIMREEKWHRTQDSAFTKNVSYYRVQAVSVGILQNRKYSLNQRLVILGFFLDSVDELYEDKQFDKIPGICDFYDSERVDEIAPKLFASVEFDANAFMINIFNMIPKMSSPAVFKDGQSGERMDEVFFYFAEGRTSMPRLLDLFREGERCLKEKIFTSYDYVIENYLVYEFFGNSYPSNLFLNAGIMTNYMYFVTIYQLLTIFLIPLATREYHIELEELTKCIAWFDARVNHPKRELGEKFRRGFMDIAEKEKDLSKFLKSMVNPNV